MISGPFHWPRTHSTSFQVTVGSKLAWIQAWKSDSGARLPILVDGGVRSGLDVVRMLALGANFVLLGRAWAYALAAAGGAGVAHALRLIEAEMRVAMALTACTSIAEADRSTLA